MGKIKFVQIPGASFGGIPFCTSLGVLFSLKYNSDTGSDNILIERQSQPDQTHIKSQAGGI